MKTCGTCQSCTRDGKREYHCPTGGRVGPRCAACDQWTPREDGEDLGDAHNASVPRKPSKLAPKLTPEVRAQLSAEGF